MICIPALSTTAGFIAYSCLALYLLIGLSRCALGLRIAYLTTRAENADHITYFAAIFTAATSLFYVVGWPLSSLVKRIIDDSLESMENNSQAPKN
jgi:hypothetical protein